MNDSDLTIVGIGASAGGLEAFHTFFDRMPADCGMAFIVVLHLPADRRSMLPEILARWTAMRVVEGSDDTLIEPNCIYVPPPHAVITLANGRLGVKMPTSEDPKIFRPIDSFFDALARSLKERAVGIVLSGTGSDGALGLKAIKENGGLTIAQGSDGNGPQYEEMPAGAIATGSVDLVAPVEEMPGHLLRIMGYRSADLDAGDDTAKTDAARLRICAIIRSQLGHDFSGYRDETFLRRVQRRMQIVNAATLDEYLSRLQADPGEVVFLFRDLLIRVTSFFRDKQTFETLESLVIPRLFDGKGADGTLRVWVPGCATGEEAYSLAMLLREHIDRLRGVPKVQLFATDIDETSIATARAGRYPATLLDGLSDARRERFFRESQGGFAVTAEIRELCTFSAHNLVRDPPFSRMNLVSCRNLLIYMDAELQAIVIPVFHYSLVPGGILLLGSSESAAKHERLFTPLDKACRIFQRRDVKSPDLNLSLRRPDMAAQHAYLLGVVRQQTEEAHRPLASPAADSTPAQVDQMPSTQRHASAAPQDPADRHERSPGSSIKSFFNSLLHPNDERVARLRRELGNRQESLQALTEEHQTALEELRSSNEELHSVNEEMQSTNEELETSKEELQSLNEELHTVNLRLTEKVDELAEKNSDLRNLFDSTEIATIFVDRFLIIRSFTSAIATLYNLIPSDQGRPLTDIVSRLRYDNLREDINRVLNAREPLERRIARDDGAAHYIMRILPYRESDSTVSGALVTFVDVTSIVQAEEALLEADLRKDLFLATLSHELRNPLAPIRTAARLLNSTGLGSAELARVQSIISRQVVHMSSLLDDLLDVSRITRGAFALKKEYFDFQRLLEAAVEAVQPTIDAKRHTLRVERPAAAIIVRGDLVRLTQVISNLLTNAAKYTPAGGLITVGSRIEAQNLTIFVRDDGIGLAPEMLTQVFNMFTRVDSDIERSDGGLGIGLALAKGLVELHGGRIEARSAGLGHGSEFIVTLPGVLVEALQTVPGPQSADSAAAIARRVVIADDNRDGAETLGMFLKMAGHAVEIAHSGTEALEMVTRLRPDIAVLDIGMPGLNGYEVAESIRRETWGAQITLIALTGWGQEDDKQRAEGAGFDHHLTKPVDPEQLNRLFVPIASA